MTQSRTKRLLAAGFLLLAVAACDNAEERAKGHYERGLAYVESGETEKAILEFRNALQLDADALAPRVEFARLMMTTGNFNGALGNFLKVIDLDPENLEARLAVARILLAGPEPEAASEHVTAALRLSPNDTEARGLQASLAQRRGQAQEATTIATDILADRPGDILATLVLVEQAAGAGGHEEAIRLLDAALAVTPDDLRLNIARLQNLEAIGDQDRIGAQLETMAGLYPDQPRVAQARVQWFLNQKDSAGAIEAQRRLAAIFADDPAHALDVAALLEQLEGPEAARGELERLAAGEAHRLVFTRALADFEFRRGEVDAAVARLTDLASGDMEATEKHAIDMQRAGFLWDAGRKTEARDIATAVLAAEPNQVMALRLRAAVALDEDRPEDAITDLRAALGVQAQNPQILVQLATAHERNGSPGLAQERLALAVQVTGAGVTESLAYADFLMRIQKPAIAEDVLADALAKRGEVAALLAALGNTQLAQSDWSGANATADRLEALRDDPQAQRIGAELRLSVLAGEQKFDESIGLLQSMWQAEGERTSALENLVSSYLRTGEIDKALDFLRGILADEPTSLRANLLLGAVLGYSGDAVGAEAQYAKVIADHPDRANGYGALATLLRSLGRVEEADRILAEGIEKAGNAERLLFFQAARLEEQGNFEGAIAIYEQLYAANKLSDVLANNLASLLSEHGTDPGALERAHAIAKRLSSHPEPAFQDTYGWILYLRGDYEQALAPLQAAAEGARFNAIVQFHLGMVLEKLGQKERAIEALTQAVELGQGGNLPQMEEAARTLAALQAQ